MPFFIFGSPGCNNSSGDIPDEVNGTAVYRDASTNLDGTPHMAAGPASQRAPVVVVIAGTATLRDVAAPCEPDIAGAFVVSYLATMTIDDDVFTADVDKAGAELTTPTGCVIGSLTRGAITSIVVRGALATDLTNCEAFCDARARADAEVQCGGARNDVACRTQSQAEASVTCQSACLTRGSAIVGEGAVAASDLAELGEIDGAALRTGTLGTLSADLVFDRLDVAMDRARSIDRREARL